MVEEHINPKDLNLNSDEILVYRKENLRELVESLFGSRMDVLSSNMFNLDWPTIVERILNKLEAEEVFAGTSPTFDFVSAFSESTWYDAKKYAGKYLSSDRDRAVFFKWWAFKVQEQRANDVWTEDKLLQLERLAQHAEKLAEELIESVEEVPNLPKIKWQWSDRAFIRLFTLLCKSGAIPFLNDDSDMNWAELSVHFERRNGTAFNPQQLSAEASKIKESRISHGDEIAQTVETAKVESKKSTEGNSSPQRITGSLNESSISLSAPAGRTGSKRT